MSLVSEGFGMATQVRAQVADSEGFGMATQVRAQVADSEGFRTDLQACARLQMLHRPSTSSLTSISSSPLAFFWMAKAYLQM
jgi:hypothetical protein